MAIKQAESLTRADFDQAVVHLRLNVSDVAKSTGIPRAYLSEFRNGDRRLKPEQLAKLRDYFEGAGVEFEPDAPVGQPRREPQNSPHERVAVATVMHFPIRGDLTPDRIRDVLQEIERNDARASELSAQKVKRLSGLFEDEKALSEESAESVRELFALFAANYVWVRYLTGLNNPLADSPATNTIQEVLLDTLRESVDRVGVDPEFEAAGADAGDDEETQP